MLIENETLIPYSPTKELLEKNFIALAVNECLQNEDFEGIKEIVTAHLQAVKIARAFRS